MKKYLLMLVVLLMNMSAYSNEGDVYYNSHSIFDTHSGEIICETGEKFIFHDGTFTVYFSNTEGLKIYSDFLGGSLRCYYYFFNSNEKRYVNFYKDDFVSAEVWNFAKYTKDIKDIKDTKESNRKMFFITYNYNPNLDFGVHTKDVEIDMTNYHVTMGINWFVIDFAYIEANMKMSMPIEINQTYRKVSAGLSFPIKENLYLPVTIGASFIDGESKFNYTAGLLYIHYPFAVGVNYDNFMGVGINIGLGLSN